MTNGFRVWASVRFPPQSRNKSLITPARQEALSRGVVGVEREAATLRGRLDACRPLGGPRKPALRPLRAVRWEPAVTAQGTLPCARKRGSGSAGGARRRPLERRDGAPEGAAFSQESANNERCCAARRSITPHSLEGKRSKPRARTRRENTSGCLKNESRKQKPRLSAGSLFEAKAKRQAGILVSTSAGSRST
jgi:hypothetical protein